jgi:two-component system OmpR family sensor kinase
LEQLLALARYDAGMSCGAPVVSLDGLVKDLVADMLPETERKGIDLGFALIDPVAARGESIMVTTMVRNLVDNAVRFTPSGGRVDIGVYREGGEAVLQIEDSGPGIPPGDIDRIFEPFYRGSRPTEDGTGLGLSIVKRILGQLGGSIVLENICGLTPTGLRVTVRLPAANASGADQEVVALSLS